MTAVIHSLASARAYRAAVADQELIAKLSVRFDGELVLDQAGRLDGHYVVPFQAKADAMGIDICLADLTADQFLAVCTAMGTWAFLARQRIGQQQSEALDEKEAYLQAVAAGKPRSVPLPTKLREALLQALAEKEEAAAPVRQLRLVETA